MIWSTNPSKKNLCFNFFFFFIDDKAVQSEILWLNVNKINKYLQSAHKQGNPSFHFHAPGSKRRYPCTQTASAVPKYFLYLLQFCTAYRIWHEKKKRKGKKRAKTVDFHTAKNIQIQPTVFHCFGRILINWTPTYFLLTSDLFTVVWPVPGRERRCHTLPNPLSVLIAYIIWYLRTKLWT